MEFQLLRMGRDIQEVESSSRLSSRITIMYSDRTLFGMSWFCVGSYIIHVIKENVSYCKVYFRCNKSSFMLILYVGHVPL